MEQHDLKQRPHRRLNLLTGEYVLVSPHRTQRPWNGLEERPDQSVLPDYDPGCYLCPANARAGGEKNPAYTSTFVFTNDYAALLPSTGNDMTVADELLVSEPESGVCKVICYSPRHDLTMARMRPAQVVAVIETWQKEYQALAALESIGHVQIFENRGLIMGCSNPHPHGQIWATSTLPTIPAQELNSQREYMENTGHCLLCSYLERELREGERILFVNDSFAALVPFWAVWPFETMIIPRFHAGSIETMNEAQRHDLAQIMIRLGICYDNLFQTSFPYSMGIHQSPTDGADHESVHWHMHYLPPLLRSQSIRKHMVGFELMAMPQRDLSAEMAAGRLRELPEKHYLEGM